MDWSYVLTIVGPSSKLLFLVYSLTRPQLPSPHRWLVVYVAVSLIADLGGYWLAINGFWNLWVSNVYSLLEYQLLLAMASVYLRQVRGSWATLALVGVLAFAGDWLRLGSLHTELFSLSMGVYALVYLLLTLRYVCLRLRELEPQPLGRDFFLIFSLTVLVGHVSTIMPFLLHAELLRSNSRLLMIYLQVSYGLHIVSVWVNFYVLQCQVYPLSLRSASVRSSS